MARETMRSVTLWELVMACRPLCELLTECLERPSAGAWDELIRLLQPSAAAAAARVLGRQASTRAAAIDDVVQQTFVRLLEGQARRLREFQGEADGQLHAFVRRVATNLAIDYLRRDRHRDHTSLEGEPEPGTPPQIPRSLQMLDIERALNVCAGQDKARDVDIFWLHYRDGWPAAAIAGRPDTALSVKGVEGLLQRLLRCIRLQIFRQVRRESPLAGVHSSEGRS